jgi:hypothetical protein
MAMDFVVIVWTFADSQRWEGPMQRWLAELTLSMGDRYVKGERALRARVVPWQLPVEQVVD